MPQLSSKDQTVRGSVLTENALYEKCNWWKGSLPCSGKVVCLLVDDLGLEDVTRLLGLSLAKVHVVDVDKRDVALVSWDHSRLSICWAL